LELVDVAGTSTFSVEHVNADDKLAIKQGSNERISVLSGGSVVLNSGDSTNGVQLTTNKKITTDASHLTVTPGTDGKIIFNPTHANGLEFTANRKITTDSNDFTIAPGGTGKLVLTSADSTNGV
jgi:hypothetical protein